MAVCPGLSREVCRRPLGEVKQDESRIAQATDEGMQRVNVVPADRRRFELTKPGTIQETG